MIFSYPPEVKKELNKLRRIDRAKMMARATHEANVGGRGAFLVFMWFLATLVVLHFGFEYGDSEGMVALLGLVIVCLLFCLSYAYFIMYKMVYPRLVELINEGKN